MDKFSKFETKVLVAFAAAVLVVVGLAVKAGKVSIDSATVALQVSRAEEVLYELAKVRGDTLLIELSTQSYRISGDTTQVAERDKAIAEREASLRQINALISDDAPQQERWTQLRQAVDRRIAIARRSVLLRKTKGVEAASAYIATAPLRETRERLFRILREMEVHERRLLDDRRAERSRVRNIELVTDWLAALALVALLTATYFFIRRQLRTTEASRRALEVANARIAAILDTAAEGIITINERGIVETIN
ncbi:MAG TPA: CHASE3 domain-containing protein, partial [Burkholderiales bacterium]|nr:CHASE3 domain-containing protein [Burkholderiales bacterium]